MGNFYPMLKGKSFDPSIDGCLGRLARKRGGTDDRKELQEEDKRRLGWESCGSEGTRC